SRALWTAPVVGFAVALVGAAVYAVAHALHVPPLPAAALAVCATVVLTGALHEDGLADVADGFGGGGTRERKLEIMRDSRIGTYGVCALALSLLLRAGALASLVQPARVTFALIAAHVGARAIVPAFMWFVPPARREGLSADAGRPAAASVIVGALLGAISVGVGLGPAPGLIALVLVLVAAAIMARLSMRQIDGQTGDVLGALEQIAEILILLVAARI
ncbi:MAG: adenosylcobinamide-GDP ribazoletransferase, partial [Xanthobacteraceae bacterium]